MEQSDHDLGAKGEDVRNTGRKFGPRASPGSAFTGNSVSAIERTRGYDRPRSDMDEAALND